MSALPPASGANVGTAPLPGGAGAEAPSAAPAASPPAGASESAAGSATGSDAHPAIGRDATLPPASAPRGQSASQPPPAGRARRALRVLWSLVLLLLLAAAGYGMWRNRVDLEQLQARIEETQRASAAAAERSAQRERDAQLKIERLEAEVERLRTQRGELDSLYLDLTRGRDEAALVEVERLVSLAAQELQVTGNVASALVALQTADARLSRIDRPQLVTLRRAITRDIERLRAAPAVDVTGLAVKLDQLARGIDGWPLLAEVLPRPAPPARGAPKAAPATPAPAPVPQTGPAQAPAPDADTLWPRMRAWLKEEFGDLVRVRDVDTPEALLLTAQQQLLVRQQMRMRLLNARHGLLTRNDRLFRSDLLEALALLNRYFDTRQASVATVATQLKQLAASPLSVDVPQLTESTAALRQARPASR